MRVHLDRAPVGMSLSVNARHRSNPERWVTSAAIDGLLGMGFQPDTLHPEMPLAPGARPDLVVVTSTQVSIFESKSHRPYQENRRQVRRYIDLAQALWPGREVRGFLLWPPDQFSYPYHEDELLVEQVA